MGKEKRTHTLLHSIQARPPPATIMLKKVSSVTHAVLSPCVSLPLSHQSSSYPTFNKGPTQGQLIRGVNYELSSLRRMETHVGLVTFTWAVTLCTQSPHLLSPSPSLPRVAGPSPSTSYVSTQNFGSKWALEVI